MARLTDGILNGHPLEKVELDFTRTSTIGYIPPQLDVTHGGTKYTPPSSRCPICGEDSPHPHTSAEVAELRVRQAKCAKLHWHTKNVVKELENSTLYYPGLFDGEGNEICKVQATDIQALIAEHNLSVDKALGFDK